MPVIPKIDWREIVHLYGLTLLTVTGFFLLGLYVGRNFPVEAEPARFPEPAGIRSSGSESKPELEFYGRLNDPTTRGADATGGRSSSLSLRTATSPESRNGSRTPPAGADRFTVQIAAMEHEEGARKIFNRVRSRNYPAVMRRPGPENPFYRVWVGEFSTEGEADRLAQRLYDDGFPTHVRNMSDSP